MLLLPYSLNGYALSASTAQVVNGSRPYLTFDNGRTKVNTPEGLLGIILSDGTHITPATNTSTETTPLVLPREGESFANIDMSVPVSTNSIALNTLIGAPNNYWGDDDGDGQGENGIKTTGDLSVNITDKNNQTVSRNTVLNICNAPYKLVLTSTSGILTTQYGVPNSSSFTGSSATYYINPNSPPTVCYIRPKLQYGTDIYAGPSNIWNATKGFLPQSTEPSSYSSNFPTTGANNLYFDLDIAGSGPLTWPTVTRGGITATMKPILSEPNNIRVTLTGPEATSAQMNSGSPDRLNTPTLQQPFELVGYDSNNKKALKYGFVLKQWFVNRGDKKDSSTNTIHWCRSIGYRLPQIEDLSNAFSSNFVGAMPSSTGNYYQRQISAGLFTEWGNMINYTGAGFLYGSYWASTPNGTYEFGVDSFNGGAYIGNPSSMTHGVCTYP